MSGAFEDFLKVIGCIVLVQAGLWFFKRVLFDCDSPEPKPQMQPRRQPQPVPDAAHEPHWIDPCFDYFGVQVKGRDE